MDWIADAGTANAGAAKAVCMLVRGLLTSTVGALLMGGLLVANQTLAAEMRCQAPRNVIVHSSVSADASIACDGAADAIAFLASQGFDTSGAVEINLVQELPSNVNHSAVGFYLESQGRVFALLYSEFKKRKEWFRLPIDRAVYRSVVAHEVAHAVAARNFAVSRPSIQAKEYIAYVTTFATMAPRLRVQMLAQFPGDGFAGEMQMSATIYLADPMWFGVQAYRHFLKSSDGRRYLHAILRGTVLAE